MIVCNGTGKTVKAQVRNELVDSRGIPIFQLTKGLSILNLIAVIKKCIERIDEDIGRI